MNARLPSSPYVSVAPRPDTRHAILTRRTFRTFERRPVPQAARVRVLEAARWAPSVEDADFVRDIVIDDPTLKKRLFRLTRESKDISNHWEPLFKSSGLRGYIQDWTHTPFCVAVCANPSAGPGHIHNGWNHHLACATATQNLALAARYENLALVMYTHFSLFPDLARINPRVLEASLIRLSLGELVSGERYGDPAPRELIEEQGAGSAVPDLMATMETLRGATRFTEAPVPAERVFEIRRAGQWTPSVGNFQPSASSCCATASGSPSSVGSPVNGSPWRP